MKLSSTFSYAFLATFLFLFCLSTPAGTVEVGIEEKLGEMVPLDIPFVDELGNPVTLGEVIEGPTVLSLVYYSCPGICTPLLNGMVEVINRTPLEPGQDFRVVTISFDTRDTPEVALLKRANYLEQVKRPFPEDHWRFLTGSQESIDRIAEAVGFRYEKNGEDFNHAATLIVLSPKGKVARYLYGISYQPFDLKMALVEASEERTGPTIKKFLKFCFSYDPEGRKYVANVTRIGMAATLLMAFTFVAVIAVRGRKERKGREEGESIGD